MGLHWELNPGAAGATTSPATSKEENVLDASDWPNEAMIFENSNRRAAFKQLLQVVFKTPEKKKNTDGAKSMGTVRKRGIPEVRLHDVVLNAVQKAVRNPVNVAGNPLINMTFVRARNPTLCPMDLVVLTDETLVFVNTLSFLQEYERLADDYTLPEDYVLEPVCEETDSEDDEIPEKVGETETEPAKLTVLEEPHDLTKLQGVVFLAVAEPRVTVAFEGRPIEVIFIRDGERQRFRRQLAHMLVNLANKSSGEVPPESKTTQAFSVVATDTEDAKKAKADAVKKGVEQMPLRWYPTAGGADGVAKSADAGGDLALPAP